MNRIEDGWMEYDSSSLRRLAHGYYEGGSLLFSVAQTENGIVYAAINGTYAKTWTVIPNVLTIDEAKAVAIANWRMQS